MLNHEAARLTPFQVVLLSFIHFQEQPDLEVAIEEQGLVKCMIAAGCPKEEFAEGILARMVEFGLLIKQEKDDKVFYLRTTRGIQSTPPAPGGSRSDSCRNN